jgi:hypothetical protein
VESTIIKTNGQDIFRYGIYRIASGDESGVDGTGCGNRGGELN